jgi:RimJ/RimL family protein N-acetyltransferase
LSNQQKAKIAPISVRGSKVGLGPYLREHIETMVEYYQDPEVTIYANGELELTSIERATERYEKLSKETDRISFVIYELEKLSVIGDAGLRDINQQHGTATLGIGIGNKDYWGKGYGTEAVKLVVDYAFRFLNLYNVYLDTNSFNERAVHAYQKAGFKEIGRRRGATVIDGQRYDLIYMDCIVGEFQSPEPSWFRLEKAARS